MTSAIGDTGLDDAARVARAESIMGFEFTDKDLLRTALTHPSHIVSEHEHADYERLEHLGDAVLGFLMTDHLFRTYPELSEGRLTKIRAAFVSGRSLAGVAERAGLADAIIVGPGAESVRDEHTPSLLADSFEAVLAAIYLDQGLDRARDFLFRMVSPDLITETLHEAGDEDPKNLLQERTQADDGRLPEYRIIREEGPPHDRVFTAQVLVAGTILGEGTASTKKEAQRTAAEVALDALDKGIPGL
jgi:ribonuclease-3